MVFRRLTLVLSLFLACGTPLWAGPQILRAARMLDVDSGKILSPAVIVVQENHISAVNPEQLPVDATTIDLGDVTLLPGLMDMHTHLTFALEGHWVHRDVEESASDAVLRGVKHARVTLHAGFTTVRNVGSGGFGGVALMRAIERNDIEGPRIVPAAHSLGVTGGHCDTTGYAPGIQELDYRQGVADGVDEVVKAVRYQIKHGAKVIKTCATAGVLSFEETVGAQQYSDDELRAMVDEADRHGIKVAAHAHGAEGILAAVKAGVASIEHGSMLTDEILGEMKQRGTYLVPTTYLVGAIDMDNLPAPIRAKAEFILPRAVDSLQRAIKARINIAFGTDAAVYPHGDNGREFAVLVQRGMSPLEAIRTATIHSADLLGVDDRGRIRKGLLADLVAVPGNPLEEIGVMEQVVFVMKDGVVAKQP
ncbi:MAG: amidohydrolase family protein [Acidobacteriota bacterium]|nr:amidohydrolase family protein [Acidobacteriota bacterium]MDH3783803.1 amidohydrolase family protein [Acidobacteriota bacterium]